MIRAVWGRCPAFLVLALASGLAGCNSNATPVATAEAPVQQSTDPAEAPVVSLPAGAACTGVIGRWRDVIENDYRTGYVDPPVYGQAEQDISRAQSACVAGRDADAVRVIQESRRRHGYPAG